MLTGRAMRLALLTTTGVLLVVAAWEFAFLWQYIGAQQAIGTDLAFFVSVAQRWLDTGQLYLPHQLAGPYIQQTDVDVLYPPIALLLFVPFIWLPFPLWWIVPLSAIGATLWRLRPAMWAWPFLAAGLAWPRTISRLIYGNTDMWLVAMIAAGLFVSGIALFVLIKPSLAPFALIGVRHRSWWFAAAFLGAVSLLMLELWQQYFVTIRNWNVDPSYSLVDVPAMLIPVVAWLARTDRPHAWRLRMRRPWLVRTVEANGRPAG